MQIVGIEEQLFLNQVSQGIHSHDDLVAWFDKFNTDGQTELLQFMESMISQSHPVPADGPAAVKECGLKPTMTPCVILSKGYSKSALSKLLDLPPQEYRKLIVVLISLFRIADSRRRQSQCTDPDPHWWHWDLSNPDVIAKIRALYAEGRL
jgi:hypothetical protein